MYPHCVPGKWVGVKGSGQTEKEVNHPRLQRERGRGKIKLRNVIVLSSLFNF